MSTIDVSVPVNKWKETKPIEIIRPEYKWEGGDLPLEKSSRSAINIPVNQLRDILKKYSPKALRVLKTNKAPVILDKQFALKQKPYSDLDLETIRKRAQMVRNNENFCKNIQTINRETAEEKEQTKTQEDLLPEETLYEKFIPNKDTALFKTWHSSSWEDKLRLLDKFQDKRCSWFGQKIIYQEAPQILPPDLYKNIKSEIARRILSKNKEKWQTVNMAYNEIDYLRDQADKRDDKNELNKLDEKSVKWMMTQVDSDLSRQYFNEYRIVELNINNGICDKLRKCELLVMNY